VCPSCRWSCHVVCSLDPVAPTLPCSPVCPACSLSSQSRAFCSQGRQRTHPRRVRGATAPASHCSLPSSTFHTIHSMQLARRPPSAACHPLATTCCHSVRVRVRARRARVMACCGLLPPCACACEACAGDGMLRSAATVCVCVRGVRVMVCCGLLPTPAGLVANRHSVSACRFGFWRHGCVCVGDGRLRSAATVCVCVRGVRG
jgi:hypothetical protein